MRRSFLLACALTLSGAMGAGANDTTGTFDSPRKISDSIVVTANRFGLSDARSVWPSTVVNLSGGIESALDTRLEQGTGVDIRNYNGLGSVATLSNWGVFNRHMLLLYNGRVVKDYSLGGFNLADYSPNELSRVEIVKGPQSAFYGSDAVGGVVNLMSPSTLADRIEIKTAVGSFGARSYFADASRKVGAFGLGAWAEFAEADNRRDNAGAQRLIGGVRSDWLSGDHRLTFSARYFEDSLGVPGPVPAAGFVPLYGSTESNSLTSRQEDENYSLDVQYRFYNEAVGEAQVDLFWEKKNLDYRSRYAYWSDYPMTDSSVTPPQTWQITDSLNTQSRTIYNKRSAGINARYLRDLGPVSVAWGVDWLSGSLRTSNTDRNTGRNFSGPYAPFDYDYASFTYWAAGQNQFDLWGNTRWSVAAPVELDLSGRVQFVHNREAQPSYNAGVVVTPIPSLHLKLGYAYAFRLPTIAEQFADDVFTAGNAKLNPETARTLAATVSYDPTPDVSSRLTFFHQEVDSLIQYEWDPSIYRSVPRNYERFQSTGIDFGLSVKVRRDLTVSWSGVWQEAEQSVLGGSVMQSAAYVPDLKWHSAAEWTRGRVAMGTSLTYTGDRGIVLWDGNRKVIASVYEIGAHTRVEVASHVQLSLSGYDLTDERRPDQFGFDLADGDYPGLGRRFYLEASFTM